MERFTYNPLLRDGQGDWIRILEVYPSRSQGDIHGTIKTCRLSEVPVYEALSYCWGDPVPNKVVYCDGKALLIPISLFTALSHLRLPKEPRTLWADAICFNQQDIPERNVQVLLMRQIYEKAKRVVIWLGEEAENSELGLGLIPKLHKVYQKREVSGDKRVFLHLQDAGMQAIYDLPSREGVAIPALLRILKRPWFERGWIIQEVAVAMSIQVQCGPSVFDLEEFIKCIVFLSEMDMISSHRNTGNIGRLIKLGLTRLAFQRGYPQTLLCSFCGIVRL